MPIPPLLVSLDCIIQLRHPWCCISSSKLTYKSRNFFCLAMDFKGNVVQRTAVAFNTILNIVVMWFMTHDCMTE
ncbi:hypothetical protein FRX31_018242 [Thalictrum thalictroides]|uniref:Uncharacterized protein n=1 Tax=Thalictrum thalictroides TaxID=46969 RepID=A0A7J6W6L3_THATH|nr:hypothetical protein FRX31_018242 [Thalictrum thalictroides]